MKNKGLFALFVTLVLYIDGTNSGEETGPVRPPCPINEHFFGICGPYCGQGTCNETVPARCSGFPTLCVRCWCNPGYVRAVVNGPCIPIGKCKVNPPSSCGPNEERSNSSSSCQPTCANPKVLACENRTQELCVCKKGFVRAVPGGGACVPENRCEITCRENEVWDKCGTACPASCHNLQPRCLGFCVRGCFCRKGFVLDDKTKRCIPEEECSNIRLDAE